MTKQSILNQKNVDCHEAKASRNDGFTLAEVLITLVIIGVIAAITVPTLIQNNQKKHFVAGFQKAQSTLSQAIQRSQLDNGPVLSWDYSKTANEENTQEFGQKYIVPYLKITKDCGTRAGEGCLASDKYFKYINGKEVQKNYDNAKNYKVVLADGSRMWFNYVYDCPNLEMKRNCMWFHIDTNGAKGPNQWGRDIFAFFLYPYTNNIVPAGMYKISYEYDEQGKRGSYSSFGFNADNKNWEHYSTDEIIAECDPNNEEADANTGCGARIIVEGYKMNY